MQTATNGKQETGQDLARTNKGFNKTVTAARKPLLMHKKTTTKAPRKPVGLHW
jgi:hypothetical protein